MTGSNVATMESVSHHELATDLAGSLVDKRVGPGVLVLAAPARVLYMNQAGWEMLQELLAGESRAGEFGGRRARGLLPASLRKICGEIFQRLAEHPCAKDQEDFELKRLVSVEHRPVLIRAFGVAEETTPAGAQAIVLLERFWQREELTTQPTTDCLPLTTRERSVVRCLAKGWTNKEIAGALQLALPTVKEHIRHIMEKTHTTTRTGILMKVFQGRVLRGERDSGHKEKLAASPLAEV